MLQLSVPSGVVQAAGRGMAHSQLDMTDPSCKACAGTWPRADHFIADLGLSKAYLHDDQFFPGWTVVVLQRHATELFHLAPPDRLQLMEDVNRVAAAIAQAYGAKKINYELLGNQLPHIHWHVIPRLANDPAPLEPVWRVPHAPLLRPSQELQREIQRIQEAIQRVP
jgi:diadenosine tetraphosphate (Ap4A) HIT family hydrolase